MITLQSPWSDLTSRSAWLEWLGIAKVEDPDGYEVWTTQEACGGCRYFDAEATWCSMVERPATRNPVLNTLGMACCGAGYEAADPQTNLFDQEAA